MKLVDILPDDSRQQVDLAQRWSNTLDFSAFDTPEELGARNLVWSLRGIEESCKALLQRQFPALMAADGQEELLNALIDTGVELGHLMYHLRHARYYENEWAKWETSGER